MAKYRDKLTHEQIESIRWDEEDKDIKDQMKDLIKDIKDLKDKDIDSQGRFLIQHPEGMLGVWPGDYLVKQKIDRNKYPDEPGEFVYFPLAPAQFTARYEIDLTPDLP
jgi:hypothetical protein